jgi:hypothetical protein
MLECHARGAVTMVEGDWALAEVRPPKVFGIGLHKTSTTSLANALYTIGYDVGGYFDTARFDSEAELCDFVVAEARARDAVQDMPWPAFYQLLDQEFPGSKFVLTLRDPQRWIASVVTHFGSRQIPSHEYVYGVPAAEGYESTYLDHLERHEREVREYFADRADDLLVMDIAGGDGWDVLCEFLGVPVPDFPFPRQNQLGARRATRYRRVARRGVSAVAAQLGVSSGFLDRGRVDAGTAYSSVHQLCVRAAAAVRMVERHENDRDRSRLEGMLRSWLDEQLRWVVDHGAVSDVASVEADLDSWDLGRAWPVIELATRRWAADLTDEGAGIRAADGSDASDALRAYVNNGVDHWGRIVRAFGLDDPYPLLEPV